MSRKGHSAEQIISILRQVEVDQSKGKKIEEACRDAQITPHTYYRWRKEYGGMPVNQAKRLKELEKENSRLKRLVADLTLDKQMLQEVAKGNF
jgi:putative transposase